MNNAREQSLDEQRRQFQNEAHFPTSERNQTVAEVDHRHYDPIRVALREESSGYDWKRETGDIQTYQHKDHGGWLHVAPEGQFYDRQAQPISRETALEHAGHVPSQSLAEAAQKRSTNSNDDQGFSL